MLLKPKALLLERTKKLHKALVILISVLTVAFDRMERGDFFLLVDPDGR